MRFFLDTADLEQIKVLNQTGMVDGITTNPTLIAKSGTNFLTRIAEISDIIVGPVSAEVTASDYDTMLKQAYKLADIAENVVIKLPLTQDGLRACAALTLDDIETNVTLCFSANQALLAAKSGATYISPFLGRLDDIGQNGIDLVKQIRMIYDNYNFPTQILAASIRSDDHILQSALAGADVATIPCALFNQLYQHDLTNKGLQIFSEDWAKTNQSIL
ncbi:MAG: transaldolase [Alphaproteobacteria bacterium]|jgi:transaldolase